MKRRWKILLTIGGIVLTGVATPIAYIESRCRDPLAGFSALAPYHGLLGDLEARPEARTWLTYPEWHIVYSADSLGRHLGQAPPSSYGYWRDIRGFWASYCLLNRATGGTAAAGEAKIMIYTIGISFSFEMAVKSLYENLIGRLSESIGGWPSADDRYAARVQQIYGAFMHQTPWYRFPFARAFSSAWRVDGDEAHLRHWERRLALSAEFGVKAGYAKLIDKASGATLGRDQSTLRFVAHSIPGGFGAIDPRLKEIRTAGGGRLVIEAPRYAEFTDLLEKMAGRHVSLVEIAGNDDVFATFIMSDKAGSALETGTKLLSLPLGDRPGWRRMGISIKVSKLLPLIQAIEAHGGELEHVYDY